MQDGGGGRGGEGRSGVEGGEGVGVGGGSIDCDGLKILFFTMQLCTDVVFIYCVRRERVPRNKLITIGERENILTV